MAPGAFAAEVNAFTRDALSPWLNFHRPCLFASETVDRKGKVRRRYRDCDVMTPYDRLRSLADAHRFLKPGITFEQLDAIAHAQTDVEAAQNVQSRRRELFEKIDSAYGTCTVRGTA